MGGVWHPGYIRAINPSNGSVKWEFEAAALGEYDHIGDIYAGINGIVLLSYTYDSTNEERLVAIRDLGSSAQNLWDIAAGGMIAFGPGNTIYTVPSGSGNVINALSVGERGDPDGLAMDYLNNNPPDIPSNPSPTDEEPNLEPDVLLSWDCSDPENHDIKYSLFVRESGYEDMVPVATDIISTSYELSGLKLGTGYSWKIIATDGQAISEGPTWVFATKPPATIYVDDDNLTGPWHGTPQHPYQYIQDGINAAIDGIKVIVEQGTYYENVNFNGKNIVLTSTDPNDPNIVANTVIDGNSNGSVVTFAGTEDPNCLLTGFTISNGTGTGYGGGIHGGGTHATISKCIMTDNSTGDWGSFGGGFYDCDGLITDCNISNNTAGEGGGGLSHCDGTINKCAITNNERRGWPICLQRHHSRLHNK